MSEPLVKPSCICVTPSEIKRNGGKVVVRDDCPYHQLAAQHPNDHSIPANCPTYWDGCNCFSEIRRLRASPGLSALTDEQLKALVHAAGYILFTTEPDKYRYHRDALAPAQQILDAELSRRRGGEDD